jgi:hypothetical protein
LISKKGIVLIGIAVVLLALIARVLICGYSALFEGQALLRAGDAQKAVSSFGKAARWYLPFVGPQKAAWTSLFEIADGDDPELSLSALRHIRGSILGSRWIVVPDSATLAQANSRITELMAVQDFKERGDRALSAAQHLELLEKDFTPFALGSILAVLLFIGWVSSLFILAWFGMSKDGKIYWPRFVGIGVVSICLLASWLVTLWLL